MLKRNSRGKSLLPLNVWMGPPADVLPPNPDHGPVPRRSNLKQRDFLAHGTSDHCPGCRALVSGGRIRVAGELRKTEEGKIRLRPRGWLIHLWCVQLRRDHSPCLSRPLFTESVSSTPVADAPDQVMRGGASGSSNTEVKRSSAPCSHPESET